MNSPKQTATGLSRRWFLKSSSAFTALMLVPHTVKAFYQDIKEKLFSKKETLALQLDINDKAYELSVDTRTTLLDLLRENLHLTGSKKAVTTVNAVPVRCMSTDSVTYPV